MAFSRLEYWSGLPFPSPEDLPDPGIEPGSPALQAGSLPTELWGKLPKINKYLLKEKKNSKPHPFHRNTNLTTIPRWKQLYESSGVQPRGSASQQSTKSKYSCNKMNKKSSYTLPALCIPWASISGKELACQHKRHETWVQSLGQEGTLKEGTATHSSVLAWRIPQTEEPGGIWSIGLRRVRHNWSDLAHKPALLRTKTSPVGSRFDLHSL